MKRDTLRLSQHQFIEASRDINGRYFIAYSGGASVFIRDVKELRRFLKIPKALPMRESLESWLASLAAMDAERMGADQTPDVRLSHVNTSFDPLAHQLDESDPNHQTRTII
jgi:hypothetical protein